MSHTNRANRPVIGSAVAAVLALLTAAAVALTSGSSPTHSILMRMARGGVVVDSQPDVPTPVSPVKVSSASEAHASSASAPAASRPSATTASSSGDVVFDPATSWALLIGIGTYDSPTHPTYGGIGDVNAFHQLLNQAGWPDSHILILTDQAATANAIRSAMHWLVAKSNGSTFSVFHYSGHVNLANGHTYMWGVDNQFISEDEFGAALQPLQGRAWIDIAGCEAAAFNHGISNANRLFTGSSMGNQKSYEEPDWHESVWTGFTVDRGMLNHEASNGPISVQQAVTWAQQQAPAYTNGQRPYGPQQPYAVGADGQGAWYLGPTSAPVAPSPAPSGGGQSGGGQRCSTILVVTRCQNQ
jgi:hypothetical protein